VIIVVVIIAILGGSLIVESVIHPQTNVTSLSSTTTVCPQCFPTMPIGDVIIPALAPNAQSGGVNEPLNLTLGEKVTLEVDVYLTINANVGMKSEVFPPIVRSSSSNSDISTQVTSIPISISFGPASLSALDNVKASTNMTIQVSSSAQTGQYYVSITAFDTANSSIIWGDYFQMNVRE